MSPSPAEPPRLAGRPTRHARAPWAGASAREAHAPFWRVRFGTLERHPQDGWRRADPVWWPRATRRAFAALCRALCPPPPAPADDQLYARIEDEVRRAMRYMHPLFALALVGATHALELSPLWARGRLQRLSGLSRDEAEALLAHVAALPLGKDLVFAARMSILSMYFDLDEVHSAIDYQPVPFMAERIRARQALLAGEAEAGRIGPHSQTTREVERPLDDFAAAAAGSPANPLASVPLGEPLPTA